MAEHRRPVVVIDTGSGVTKAGLGGEDSPKIVFPTVIGRPRHQTPTTSDQRFIGDEARKRRGVLTIKYPIDEGVIFNWDDWEILCNHIFDELNMCMDDPEHSVLLVRSSCIPKCQEERATQIMFETFEVPSFYMAADAALSLLQAGRTTGIVLETGHGSTKSVPIYEGCFLPHCVQYLHMTGREITYYLLKILGEKGYDLNSSAQLELVQDIKEKLSYIAFDFDEELKTGADRRSIEKSYELPDGQRLTLSNERFRCAEALFRPNLTGLEMPGVHEILHNSIMKCDVDIRADMYANIVLSGGNAMFSGFAERISKEMTNLAPAMKIRVSNNAPIVKYQAWKGGSILASSSNFPQMSISKEEYDEYGPALVHRKCF